MREFWEFWAYVVIFVMVIVVIPTVVYYNSSEIVEITVNEKVVQVSGSNSTYLIFTDDEVFKNSDAIFYLKFNSSDIQNALKESGTYKVKVAGYRFQMFSWYRNIISIEKD
jgi:hypothetical protein